MKTEKTKNNINKKEEVKKEKSHPLIKGPRMTEKSALSSDRGAYTFNVKTEATKNEIKKAISMIYGVIPTKVTIIKIQSKTINRRGISGIKQGGKKAVVYLKKGDKITFV